MSTILVVDDDPTFGGLIKTVFGLEGHEAVIVSKQEEVMPTARQVRPALVLMDLHVSRGDTLGVLRQLRADDALRAIPVVMTSGMDRSEECMAAGANIFILKPFRPSKLIEMVTNLVQGADA
jgi:CheY-like chemotaxis protein